MPKLTKDFENEIDYKEAFAGKSKGHVFMGNLPFGLINYREHIDKHGETSKYVGRVLYPERGARKPIDGGNWNYAKNQAFWAGIIDSGQTVLLVTDINYYKKPGKGTIDELLWLQDNGYTFQASKSRPHETWVIPPKQPLLTPFFITSYYNGYKTEINGVTVSESSYDEMERRLENIKIDINDQRLKNKRSASISSSSSSYISSSSSQSSSSKKRIKDDASSSSVVKGKQEPLKKLKTSSTTIESTTSTSSSVLPEIPPATVVGQRINPTSNTGAAIQTDQPVNSALPNQTTGLSNTKT